MSAAATTALPASSGKAGSTWTRWGRLLVLPYLLIFVVFVLYPVAYGLWLARHPSSYVALANDPVFFRTVINTFVFLVVAVNVKMMVALALWGLGCFSVNSAQQARLLHTAPMLASVSIALNSSAMYLGQALGAETGGHLVELAGFEWLPRVTLPVFGLAVAVSVWASRGSGRPGKSGRAASR